MQNAKVKIQTTVVLLAAYLTADAVTVIGGANQHFPHPAAVCGYALLFAQVGLGAIWLGVGGSPFALRLAGYVAVVGTVYFGLSVLHDNGGQWASLLAVHTLAIAGPLAAARAYGLRLQLAGVEPSAERWQFTLKHVFVLTTACAVLLGLVRLAPKSPAINDHAFQALMIGAAFALMALVASWAAIGHGRRVFKLAALPTVTLLACGLLTATEGRNSLESDLGIMGIVFGQMLFLATPLFVLRRLGYRLVRCRA